MKYKNLTLSSIFEIIIGFGCIISVSFMGYNGFISLALIGLRPLILEREPIADEKKYFKLSYKIILSSLIIILLFIVSIFILIFIFPGLTKKLPTFDKILFLLIPFFLMTKGVIGLLYSKQN